MRLLVFFASIVYISFFCTNIQAKVEGNEDPLASLETSIMTELYGSTMHSTWIDVNVQNDIWKTHVIYSERIATKDTVLLIHGYGTTSALAWRGVIPRISATFNVVAVDLPGFGRSVAAQTLRAAASGAAIIDLYCDFYENFLTAFNLSDPAPYVVAHSFGGFVFAHCIARYPQRVSRLLLADIPGLYSMNGGWDWYWSSFYVLGLPYSLLRLFGRDWGYSLITMVLSALEMDIDDKYVRYWHEISPHMQCGSFAGMFIRHRGLYSVGVGLVLEPLMQTVALGVPVTLMYGSEDSITPLHQGLMFSTLTGVPVKRIDGAGHVPYANGGADFAQVVLEAASQPAQSSPLPVLSALTDCMREARATWEAFPCLPLPPLSTWLRHRLYDYLRSVQRDCAERTQTQMETQKQAETNIEIEPQTQSETQTQTQIATKLSTCANHADSLPHCT